MIFENKLHVILELFDDAYSDDAMDGVFVDIVNDGSAAFYNFVDQKAGDRYEVTIKKTLVYSDDNNVENILRSIAHLKLPGILNAAYVLTLNSGTSGYDLTGLGNANFVYGKMLACFFDFIKKHGIPAIMYFDAYDIKTNLTYEKLLKFVARVKGLKYKLVDRCGIYVLDEVWDKILDNMENRDDVIKHIDLIQQNQEIRLDNIKRRKAMKRRPGTRHV